MSLIAGAGFARMAWRLAWSRELPMFADMNDRHEPLHRDNANYAYPASREYYRIIDKAWEAWQLLPGSRPMHQHPRMVL